MASILGWHKKHKQQRQKINKWDYVKLKIFFTAKDIIKKNEKATYGMGENICKLYIW